MGEVTASVEAAVRALIAERAPGDKLPSERALVADLGASRSTVRLVMVKLVAEALIRSEHGRGYFVGQSTPTAECVPPRESPRQGSRRASDGSVRRPARQPPSAATEATSAEPEGRRGRASSTRSRRRRRSRPSRRGSARRPTGQPCTWTSMS